MTKQKSSKKVENQGNQHQKLFIHQSLSTRKLTKAFAPMKVHQYQTISTNKAGGLKSIQHFPKVQLHEATHYRVQHYRPTEAQWVIHHLVQL